MWSTVLQSSSSHHRRLNPCQSLPDLSSSHHRRLNPCQSLPDLSSSHHRRLNPCQSLPDLSRWRCRRLDPRQTLLDRFRHVSYRGRESRWVNEKGHHLERGREAASHSHASSQRVSCSGGKGSLKVHVCVCRCVHASCY